MFQVPCGIASVPLKYQSYLERLEDFTAFTDLNSDKYLTLSMQKDSGKGIYYFVHPSESIPDPDFGSENRKSVQTRQAARTADRIVFDAIYSFDEFGRRMAKIPAGEKRKKFVALYGCSYTLGHGVNDDETLNFQLGQNQSDYYPYNYAVGGSGPNMLLAKLAGQPFFSQIPQKNGVLIYIFMNGSLGHAIGYLPSLVWSRSAPYYKNTADGQLERSGSFLTGRPFLSHFLLGLHEVYRLLGMESTEFPQIGEQEISYFCDLISQIQTEFSSQYPQGKFIFYAHPFSSPPEVLTRCLREKKLSMFKGGSCLLQE